MPSIDQEHFERTPVEPRARAARSATGFTLTEMLVVVGILVLIVSLIVPAVMRARKQARLAVCMNNLRQLGSFYLLYAERNDDYIPLGVSQHKDPKRYGVVAYTPFKPPPNPPVPWEWPDYHTMNNQYLWVEGSPSAAMGPFLLCGLIKPGNAKILHCPSEMAEVFRWEYNASNYQRALKGESVSIIVSYAVRPMKRIWTHDYITRMAEYPPLMPKLMRNDRVALLAEHPQLPPYTHGAKDEHTFNVLYADGNVHTVAIKTIGVPLAKYAVGPWPYPPGYRESSNIWAIREEDPAAETIWKLIDQN